MAWEANPSNLRERSVMIDTLADARAAVGVAAISGLILRSPLPWRTPCSYDPDHPRRVTVA
ncbi:hypothetical protein P5V34_04670 [Mycobacteroides abscessus subsp. abscessus]|uniref:hypothetical protein n=1 Tax=Mycobacteroides abscessus TaxID=36809 RepID=UPI00266D3782|nr:hypothetical protein [Mycobacteroides abscessus]MDO3013280.1 hypothetical protein [Mycobacteroides abscessus subsp. abscessus]